MTPAVESIVGDESAIPQAMRAARRWLVWRHGDMDAATGKRQKVPCDVATGRSCSPTDAAHWYPYADALKASERFDGLGFALGDDSAGVDLDGCRHPDSGELTSWAHDIVAELDSYTEVSPSRTGVKVFVRIPRTDDEPPLKTEVREGLEVYIGGRYFAVTGWHVQGTPRDVQERYDPLGLLLFREFSAHVNGQKARTPTPTVIPDGARNHLLHREGCRLRRLGWQQDEIAGGLSVLNMKRCDPPLEEREVRGIAHSCCKHDPAADIFNLTEAGDAEFFAAVNADIVRYDHRRGRWLVFTGHRWEPTADGEVHRLALETIRARQAAAIKETDDTRRQLRLRWSIAGEARKRLTNLLAIAESTVPLADAGDSWDADPWLLGVKNGVVDLRTGVLRPGQPEDRITMSTSAAFDADAGCPLWNDTLNQIFAGDALLLAYVDRFLGYSLTGLCDEEALALAWGAGANGKGTLMNTFAWVMGDYADDLPFSALELHERSGIPNDIAKIVGKRFVTSSETGETRRLNEARVKALTGRDPITARFLHREFFTFQPVAKFWLATNQRPIVRDQSVGFWRRLQLIPFTQSFASAPNLRLKDDLRAEASGILARAVRGCLSWRQMGLSPPQQVRDATAQYRAESAPLSRFFDDCCAIEAGGQATFGQLFEAYKWWCAENREGSRLTRREFGAALHERFERGTHDKRHVTYVGIRLLHRSDEDAEHHRRGMPGF